MLQDRRDAALVRVDLNWWSWVVLLAAVFRLDADEVCIAGTDAAKDVPRIATRRCLAMEDFIIFS